MSALEGDGEVKKRKGLKTLIPKKLLTRLLRSINKNWQNFIQT